MLHFCGDFIVFTKDEREALAVSRLRRITGKKIHRIYGKNKLVPKHGFQIKTPLDLELEKMHLELENEFV